jgi:hypothetical protein
MSSGDDRDAPEYEIARELVESLPAPRSHRDQESSPKPGPRSGSGTRRTRFWEVLQVSGLHVILDGELAGWPLL